MKSDKLRIALETLKGSISSETDAVELTGQIARASDGLWWSEATLSDSISTSMTLPFSKFRSIVKTLNEDDEIEMGSKDAECVIKGGNAEWRLNLRNVTLQPAPEFKEINRIEGSGYALPDAYKSLKHLIQTDLSKPGLMWAWVNDKGEMVIGDGARIGGCYIGIKGLELPTMVLSEVCRILAVRQSEKVIWSIGDKHVRAIMRDCYFQAALLSGPRLEVDWYKRVKDQLDDDPHILRMSRSEIMRAINQVEITSGDSMVKLTSGNGDLNLTSRDEYGNNCMSKIEVSGNLKEPMSLNIEHLESALRARTEELIAIKVCKSVVEISDKTGWEIMIKR